MTLVNFNNKSRANALNALDALNAFNASNSPYFNTLESLFSDVEAKNTFKENLPAVNISESEENFKIDLAAPGLKREDFQINLKKDVLTVSVENKNEDDKDNKQFSRREFNFGSFSRSFNMPENADTEQIAASYLDGILSITINKQDEKSLQREITVS